MSYAKIFESGSLLQIHLSILKPRPVFITRVPQRGAPKGLPSQIGENQAHCYGFTENVRILSSSQFKWSLRTPGLIAGSGKSILRYVTKSERVATPLNLYN